MSDADTGSDDSKDSNTVGVPQFLVVNNVHMLNGDHHHVNMYEETVDDGEHIIFCICLTFVLKIMII